MGKLVVACGWSGRVYAGRLNKKGDAFLDGKQDVTSDVLKAVIDKIKPGNIETVTVDGVPVFEIEVRRVGNSPHTPHVAAGGENGGRCIVSHR
jgi:hypothetical protein